MTQTLMKLKKNLFYFNFDMNTQIYIHYFGDRQYIKLYIYIKL